MFSCICLLLFYAMLIIVMHAASACWEITHSHCCLCPMFNQLQFVSHSLADEHWGFTLALVMNTLFVCMLHMCVWVRPEKDVRCPAYSLETESLTEPEAMCQLGD